MGERAHDVVVVGGGIVGTSVALELVRRGIRTINLDCHKTAESSATLASGAMLGALAEVTCAKSSAGDALETEFRIRAARSYPDWIEQLDDPALQLHSGTVVVANSSGGQDLRNIDRIHAAALEYGEAAEWLDNGQLIPGLKPHISRRPQKVLLLSNEKWVDARALLHASRQSLANLDVATLAEARVKRVLWHSGRAIGVETVDGETHHSSLTVLCSGVGTQQIIADSQLGELGLPAIIGGKGSGLTIKSEEKFPFVIRTPNRDFACGTHLVPQADGTQYIGATNRMHNTPGYEPGASAGEIHAQLHNTLHEINVGLRQATITGLRSGTRPLCVDGFPLVGATAMPGLLIATGTYRNGVLLAPLIAKIIAGHVAGGASPQNPFEPSKREALLEQPDYNDLVEEGVEDLLLFIQGPHGSLPYNRTQELADMLTVLLRHALKTSADFDGLFDRYGKGFRRNPMTEVVPKIMYEIHRLKSAKKDINDQWT
jgi:glycine oxidase